MNDQTGSNFRITTNGLTWRVEERIRWRAFLLGERWAWRPTCWTDAGPPWASFTQWPSLDSARAAKTAMERQAEAKARGWSHAGDRPA